MVWVKPRREQQDQRDGVSSWPIQKPSSAAGEGFLYQQITFLTKLQEHIPSRAPWFFDPIEDKSSVFKEPPFRISPRACLDLYSCLKQASGRRGGYFKATDSVSTHVATGVAKSVLWWWHPPCISRGSSGSSLCVIHGHPESLFCSRPGAGEQSKPSPLVPIPLIIATAWGAGSEERRGHTQAHKRFMSSVCCAGGEGATTARVLCICQASRIPWQGPALRDLVSFRVSVFLPLN